MTGFSRIIMVDEQEYTFLFRKVWTPKSEKYFISAYDREQEVISFELVKNTQLMWEPVPPVPSWVETIKWQLGMVIEQNKIHGE